MADSPATLKMLQRFFEGIHYLIIDEKNMLGLQTFGWINRRLGEIFPHRRDEYFGGLNVIIIGDFFQLPPVLQKPLFAVGGTLKKDEIVGRNAYQSFTHFVFLDTILRQQGEKQAAFRQALQELRVAKTTTASWELLASRCAVKLPPEEVERFAKAPRIYPLKKQVNAYNQKRMMDLAAAVIHVEATNDGPKAAQVDSQAAGNLSKSFPICIGCRVMITRNIWSWAGLVNGAQSHVYDISWAERADVSRDPPEAIMVVFDKYKGPPFTLPDGSELRNDHGNPVIPIERVRQEFTIRGASCSRLQFPLMISYAVTVHKSQGLTLEKVVCNISKPEFASGLSYVAVLRVSNLFGLMFDCPFSRNRIYHEVPLHSMQMRLDDDERRRQQRLEEPLYVLEL
ncbi:ATP-dependent DNA helicase PIF1 [Daldinia childiae]|uniref:ATP-dependent DNA helicase PIF1 n=1 Tax=Daldinia childiae TaxID=326645 RepID=UPI00144763B7|nr:ATP-dependent DNA helicase PIF1 [Daldinia childiae]KAF3055703.1 ATP-dependent DNA helicase PIF1 [Daldinia childiae]